VSYPDNVTYLAENLDKTFEGVTSDDTDYSQIVAERYRTQHKPLIFNLKDYAPAQYCVIWYRKKPLQVMSQLGPLKPVEAAKEYVTMLLT
jgi:asparagine synthetase B (glutamine-hydrolysing)